MIRSKWVCCYRTGPKFSTEYVYRLKNMVERHGAGMFDFVCLTDHPDILKEPFAQAFIRPEKTGWWCLPEKFRIVGPVVFSGLDTIIVQDISKLADIAIKCFAQDVYMIRPFRIPNQKNRLFANGLMVWNGDLSYIFDEYDYSIAANSFPLEQDYTSAMLIKSGKNIKVLQHDFPGIHSFKIDLGQKAPRLDTRIILFHGNPAIHELQSSWIRENWK